MKISESEKAVLRSKLREEGIIDYAECCFNCAHRVNFGGRETCSVHGVNVLPDEGCAFYKGIFNT